MSYAHILGTMYEHSSYYDKGFIIDELMLYHIIYDLYHDPYQQWVCDLRKTISIHLNYYKEGISNYNILFYRHWRDLSTPGRRRDPKYI